MRSQTIISLAITVIFGSLIVGCGNNALTISSTIVAPTGLDVSDSNNNDVAPIPPTTQSLSETKGEVMTTPTQEENTSWPGVEVFNFGSDEPLWYTVDDRVMGGISRSTVDIRDSETLHFTGTMSLESNGGFSSARSEWKLINLENFDGILLRVLGDGKMYRLRIRTAETGSEISYNTSFETNPEKWTLVYVPFKNMVPTYRGFVMDVDPLEKTSIGSFGFMLSDGQSGEFDLKVDWIRAVSEEELRAFSSNLMDN